MDFSKGKKKIAIVFDQIPQNGGGIITACYNLLSILEDFDVELISIFESKTGEFSKYQINHIVKNVDLQNMYHKIVSFSDLVLFIVTLIKYVLSVGYVRFSLSKKLCCYDYVIVNSPSAAIFMPNIPFILDIQSNFDYFFDGSIKAKLQVFLARKPKSIVFRTKSDANKFSELPKSKGIKTYFVYNYVNDKVIANLNFVDNRICYVGRLETEKNLFYLVDIAKELYKNNSNIIIDIYGKGTLENELRNYISRNGLNEVITLKGYTTDKNVYSHYSMLWVTSLYEGFCLVILEAKRCGTPCISSFWGDGSLEIVNNGLDGFVCKTKSQFIEKSLFLLNEENQVTFREHALKNSVNFSAEESKKKWIKIFDELL